jgi:hypothetical protein
MKKPLLVIIPCLLMGTGVFFAVNHAARAQAIAAVAGELPNIPGCPFHESCVTALQQEQAALLPRFPAGTAGGFAGAGAALLCAAALMLAGSRLAGRRRFATAAG